MSWNARKDFYSPTIDASMGLIYRLNYLMEAIDRKCLLGDYNGWEITLDRIFSNLLYRNELDVIKDDDGNIIDVKLSDEDNKIRLFLKHKIREAKTLKIKSFATKNIANINRAHETYYNYVMLYDVWVRKLMQKMKLYLKESESNPSKALFGR